MKNITLIQIIETVLEKGNEDWYIRGECSRDNYYLMSDNIREAIFNDKRNNYDFQKIIAVLLHSSGKDELPINELFDCLTRERLRHTLLCYIYGCFLYNSEQEIKNSIDVSLSKTWEKAVRAPQSKFLLTWLLICLFHDIGYAIEEGEKDSVQLRNILNGFGMSNIFDNEYDLICDLPSFPNDFPPLYENIPAKYDKYRRIRGIIRKGVQVYDHGIYGGVLLNKALEKMPGKYGMPKQYYEYIVWVVMCHNMWFAMDEKQQFMYKELGMKSLCIPKGEYHISLEKHPFLWLLSVVDNLECTKKKVSVKWLDEITIDELITDYLKVSVSEKAKKGRYVDKYLESLDGLNDWLMKTKTE